MAFGPVISVGLIFLLQAKFDESKTRDFYKLLGVDKKANQEEIKKAYR